MNFLLNLLYVTLIHIPLSPWEDIVSKNQMIKSLHKILQYEKSYWIIYLFSNYRILISIKVVKEINEY